MKLGTVEFVEHAVVECARLIKRLDDAYPDVGWGMIPSTAVEQAMTTLGVTLETAPEGFVKQRCIDKLVGRRR